MKKNIFRVSVLVVMIISMCLPTCQIAVADNALSGLTAEMLTKECSGYITKDLVLPEQIAGADITWTSNNASAVSDTGVVTRERSETKSVTLTATVDDGVHEKTKDFHFEVAPKMTYIYYQNNFYEPEYEGEEISRFSPCWYRRWDSNGNASSTVCSEIYPDGSKNFYLRSDLWKDRPSYAFETAEPDGKFSVAMRLFMSSSDIADEIYDYTFCFSGGETVKTRFTFYEGENNIYLIDADGEYTCIYSTQDMEAMQLLDCWVNAVWELDLDKKTMNLYINDILINDNIINCMLSTESESLSKIQFDIGSNESGLTLGMDDFVVFSDMNEDSLPAKTLQTRLRSEHFTGESVFAVTQNLDFSLMSVPELTDLITQNRLSVSIESSNPDRLLISGSTGIVTRGECDEKVIVTASITKADSDVLFKKSLEYVIKNRYAIVHASDALYYPEDVGKRIAEIPTAGFSAQEQLSDGLDARLARTEGNCALSIFRGEKNEEDYNVCRYEFANPLQKTVTVEGRIRFENPASESQIYICRLYGNYSMGTGEIKNAQLAELQFFYSTDSTSVIAYYFDREQSEYRHITLANAPRPSMWEHFKITLNVSQQSYDVSIGGVQLNNEPIPFYNRDNSTLQYDFCTGVTGIRLYPYRSYSRGKILFDDFALYSQPGILADAAIFNSAGDKIDGLETAESGESLSASVYFYPNGELTMPTQAEFFAAVYSFGRLISVVPQKLTISNDEGISINFPVLLMPQNIEGTELKFFFWESGSTLRPLCNPFSAVNRTKGTFARETVTDAGTGRTYYTFDAGDADVLKSYYTMPIWAADGKRFYFYTKQFEIFEYNTETEEYRYIDKAYGGDAVTTSALGNLFYISANREIIRLSTDTYEKQVVGVLPMCYTSVAMLLQVNRAETKLSIEGYSNDLDRNQSERIPIMDIATGQWSLDWQHGFPTITYAPDHFNLNPVYDNLVLLAHEGNGADGNGCMDRIWLLDTSSGTFRNVFKQKQYTSAIPGEVVGHEGWSHDGEKIVAALSSPRIGPGGIVVVRADGSDRHYVNNEYDYLHAAASLNTDRFVISDTAYNGKTTKLVLIDCYTGRAHLLATLDQTGKNPGHTHPNFSFDGNKVIFSFYDEDGKIKVGWMDVSDIVNAPLTGGSYSLSNTCKTTGYAGESFYVYEGEIAGKSGFVIPSGNHMNVNVRLVEIEQTDIDVTVTYLDNGTKDSVLEYLKWQSGTTNRLVLSEHHFNRQNSGNIRTETVRLTDVNLENMKLLGTDFTLKGGGDTLIKAVTVQVINE